MDAEREIDRLLKEHGAELKRDKRHLIYKLPNGKTFTRSSTPSDRQTPKAELSDLKMALGLTGADGRGTPGERREKRPKGKPQNGSLTLKPSGATGHTLSEQLSASGVVEGSLREELRMALDDIQMLGFHNETLVAKVVELEAVKSAPCVCWWCRLKRISFRV